MTDRRRNALRFSAVLPLPPPSLCPRLLTEALDLVSRRVRPGRRTAGTTAVCAAASGCRLRPGPQDESGGGASVRPLRRSPVPGLTDPHQRAEEVIESRTAGPDDLASLREMLGLRPAKESHENRARTEGDRDHPGPQ
ncbi:hypothetical protein [Streptomyces sp. NPDC058401]|uniref:hypothetical protein n=1 Tax=Streptomyces sp. NPDC058401 TaxID=3346480 RepID=UPI00365BC8DB